MLIIVHTHFKTLTLRYSARFKISYFKLNAACILSCELASNQSPMHTHVHVNKHKTKTKQLGNIHYVDTIEIGYSDIGYSDKLVIVMILRGSQSSRTNIYWI